MAMRCCLSTSSSASLLPAIRRNDASVPSLSFPLKSRHFLALSQGIPPNPPCFSRMSISSCKAPAAGVLSSVATASRTLLFLLAASLLSLSGVRPPPALASDPMPTQQPQEIEEQDEQQKSEKGKEQGEDDVKSEEDVNKSEGVKEKEEDVEADEEEMYSAILSRDPGDVDALKCALYAKMKRMDWGGALQYARGLREAEPAEVDWRLMEAQLHELQGDLAEAERQFREVLTEDPLLVRALHGLALCMHKRFEGHSAIEMLENALQLAVSEKRVPVERNIKLLTAQMHVVMGELDVASEKLQNLINEDPRDFRPHLCQGIVYALLDKKEEADVQFDIYRSLVPDEFPDKGFINDIILAARAESNDRKDSLIDLSFHVPITNTQFVGDEHRTPAHMLWQEIKMHADVDGSSESEVVSFDGIAILTPRGRFRIELHTSFLRLQGQANDFKIQYSSILRLFVLPKSQNPHTFVVITLDPPIRKGQTLYPHIVIQFETEVTVERDLTLSEEVLAEKYKGRDLKSSYRGLIHEVFSKVLKGLSCAKVTRPSTFRSCLDGFAVKSSLKAEDGLLYPLEKGFFFLPKPPTLILHEEIEYVEFERHGAGGASMSSHYFDLLVKLKNDQEHLFRNIQRNEYHNLFNFISGKHLKIMNLGDGQARTGGVTAVLQSTDDDSVDPHLERIKNQTGNDESDEEDEDFVAEKDDSGSPTDDSDEGGSDASLSGGEKDLPKEKSSKKEAGSSKQPPVKRMRKAGTDEGSEKRKPKKKKDPNAPKRAIAPFMYFSKAERANIKSSNPELATTEIAKKLGEKWQKMTAEEKQPYVEQSQADKQRYAEESAAYRSADAPGSGGGSE